MPKTNYLSAKVIDHTSGVAAYTMPTVYLGLSSTAPTVAGGNVTEPSTGAYARVEVTSKLAAAALDGSVMTGTNTTEFVFPESTAAWLAGASLTHAVIFDAAIGGNLLRFAALATARTVEAAGITIRVPVGALDIVES